MSLLQSLNRATFGSSIGKKYIVAITGVLLIGFLIGHLLGNLQVFLAPEWINAYGHHLQTFPLLWPIRLGLLAIFALHIVTTIILIKENRAARGGQGYDRLPQKYSTVARRTMALSGLTVLSFVVYHILHFTAKTTHPEYRNLTTVLHGETVPDVHSMMVIGFQDPVNVAIYLISMALLCLHLSHGFASLWQTFGLNTRSTKVLLTNAGRAFSAFIFLGYASIPTAIMTGVVKRGETAVPIEKQDPASIPALHDTPKNEVSNPDSIAPVTHQH